MNAVVAFAIGGLAGRLFNIAVQTDPQKISQTFRCLSHRGLRDAPGR